ncbi:transforming DNA uptake protein (plasmid) [Halorhabdus tiamatea SARL4B]|uniref:Transforming DNA uptake protein n=1 Tax=Halorhabdus tiamatea SARL4B TaxID=1033806 RepID=S6D2H0_9EURY|nr:transforming DNA uptake protein [Halorhabdus tiamatea SARL4B]
MVLVVGVLLALAGCSGTTTDATPAETLIETTTLTDATTPTASPATTPGETSSTTPTDPDGTLSVHYLNVGQGSATLVVGPTGETMLIDSGDWRDDGEIVLDYLRQLDIDGLDYLVTSHADADHIGGHAAVIEYFETEGEGIGAVYDPGITSTSNTYERYLDAIEDYNVTLYQTRAGDEIPLKNVNAQVLAPPEDYIANGDRNENSLVMRLAFGKTSMLLPGDGETASEEYLRTEYGDALNVSVLAAGHHGSQSSTGDAFLDTTAPQIAVISSAYDSQYGHPDEAVLQRLAERSIRTYWTATHGNIQLRTNGSALTVATQAVAPTSPLDLRDGSPVEPGNTDPLEDRTIVSTTGTVTTPVATDGGSTTPTATETPTATTTPTATETPTATATPTATESGTLAIAEIHEDAQGTERENLNDEYVVFENTGDEALDLSGWTVDDAADHTYTFPSGFTLDPGAQVTLHTGSGTDSATDLYWGSGSPIWNNAGDTVFVHDDEGTPVLTEEY